MRKLNVLQFLPLSLILCSINAFSADSIVDERLEKERATEDKPFVITPHKANYILPVTYQNRPNNTPFEEKYPGQDVNVDEVEAKFQISFKFPVWHGIWDDNGSLYFAYTNQSYWQVYNKEVSSPFRETNHEPAIFVAFDNDWEILGMRNSIWGFGAVHQSNGQSQILSRSWNRIYGSMIFDRGPFAMGLKVWWRIPEDEKASFDDPKGDDNPDITDYMGNFELEGVYALGEHRFTATVRNNLQSDNRGSGQFTWSYPILGNLRLYAQYFNGYGESLIDYDHHNQRIGIGIALNDIL